MYGAGSGDGFSGQEDHIPVTGNVPAGSDKGLLNTSCVLMELPQLPFPKIPYRRAVVQSPTAVYARRVRTVQRHQESHVVMPTKIFSYVGYLLYITVYVCAIIYVASPERLYIFQYLLMLRKPALNMYFAGRGDGLSRHEVQRVPGGSSE